MMARLGDVCKIVSGTTPKSNIPEYWDGEINWITPAELNDDTTFIYESQRKITEQAVRDSSLKSFPAGTVILSSCAPIGKVAIAGVEMYCNQGFKNLICSERIHNKYLFWFLKSKTDFLNSLGRGATFKEISKTIVENIDIPLPSIKDQKKYAAILNKVNDLISLRKQQLAKLDELVKARFVEIFGDPVSNPMNWATRPLGNECSIITGNTPSRKVAKYYGDYIEWIKSDNINTPQAILTVAEEGLSKEGLAVGRAVDSGSILMTCIAGSIGCIGNVAIANRRVAFNQQINGIIPNNNNVWFMYIQFELSKKAIQSSINMALKGILSKRQLSEMKFIFPPIELQNEYGHFAAQIDKSKLTIQQSMDKLEMLKKALMQEYFG